MTIKDDLTGYQPPKAAVERIDGSRVTCFLGDEQAPLGTALGFLIDHKTIFGVVERHLGARRAQIWLPTDAELISTDTPLVFSDTPAGFAIPDDRRLDPSDALLRPLQEGDLPLWPPPPALAELTGHRPPLHLGIEPLDILAPLCLGGLTLIVDTTGDDRAFKALAQRALNAAEPDELLLATDLSDLPHSATLQIDPAKSVDQEIFGLQLAMALATSLRSSGSTLALIDLPALAEFNHHGPRSARPGAGLAEIIDRLGRHLVSTHKALMTTLLRLRLSADHRDLAQIIETLHLGDLDGLLYLTSDGRFDPRRSSSRAELDADAQRERQKLLQLLSLASRAEDKSAIFGDLELTDDERLALERAPALYASLL